MTALATAGLTRRYGRLAALDAVDLEVPDGIVFGLVGPNGSGKTTLLEIVAGIRHPTAGSVTVAGRVTYCPDVAEFEPWLAPHEVLEVAGCLLGRPVTRTGAQAVLERVGLGDVTGRRVGGFSRGMTTRLNIAAALIGDPALILLDEPAAALDPAGRIEMLRLISALSPAATVIISSHDLAEIEAVCDQVGILSAGKLLYSGPLDALLSAAATPRWRLVLRPPAGTAVAALQNASWVDSVEQHQSGQVEFTSAEPALVEANVAALLVSCGARVVSLTPLKPTFEQVFLGLTTGVATTNASTAP